MEQPRFFFGSKKDDLMDSTAISSGNVPVLEDIDQVDNNHALEPVEEVEISGPGVHISIRVFEIPVDDDEE
jgi:hypothetical protein